MEQELSLDDVLDGKGTDEIVEDEVVSEDGALETVEEDDVDTTGETDDSPPESQTESEEPAPSPGQVPVAALADERAKRQAAVHELDDLRLKMANQVQYQQPEQGEVQPEEIDFLTDPDGWRDNVLKQVMITMKTLRTFLRQ